MVFVPAPYKRNSLVGPLMSIIANAAMQKSAQGARAAEAQRDRDWRDEQAARQNQWGEQRRTTAWERQQQATQEAASRREIDALVSQLPPGQQAMYRADPEGFRSMVEGTGQPFEVGIKRLLQMQGQPGVPQFGQQPGASMVPSVQTPPAAPPARGPAEAQTGAQGAKNLMGRLMPHAQEDAELEQLIQEQGPLVAPDFDYKNASLEDLQGRLAELKAKEASAGQEMAQGFDLGEEEQPGLFGKMYPGGGGLKSVAQDLALFGGRGRGQDMTARMREARDPALKAKSARDRSYKLADEWMKFKRKLALREFDKRTQLSMINAFKEKAAALDLEANLMNMRYDPNVSGVLNEIDTYGQEALQAGGGRGGGRRRPAAGGGGTPAQQVPAHLKSIYAGLIQRGYDPQDALTEAQSAYDAGVR